MKTRGSQIWHRGWMYLQFILQVLIDLLPKQRGSRFTVLMECIFFFSIPVWCRVKKTCELDVNIIISPILKQSIKRIFSSEYISHDPFGGCERLCFFWYRATSFNSSTVVLYQAGFIRSQIDS